MQILSRLQTAAFLAAAASASALTGCRGAAGTPLSRATVDTLPSGIVRVLSDAPTAWRDTTGWQLVEAGRFSGEENTPSEVINPQTLALDEAGRVYLADQKPAVIKVYHPDGRLLRTIGREGEGPGEFRVAMIAVRNGVLAVHDPQTARTSVFDAAGTFRRSWPASCCYWSPIAFDRAGRIYVPTNIASEEPGASRGNAYTRYDSLGTTLDTLFLPRGPEARSWTVRGGSGQNRFSMGTTVPYSPTVRSGYAPEGGFVYGLSSGYQLAVSATGSDTLRLFGRAWTPGPITAEQKQETVERTIRRWNTGAGPAGRRVDDAAFRAAVKAEDIPSALPAFESIRVDEEGNRWIRFHELADSARTHFDVFDGEGAWLGRVVSPILFPGYGREAWGRGEVVMAIEDEEGRPAIVRYRIEKSGGR
jgi:hypothetical protein